MPRFIYRFHKAILVGFAALSLLAVSLSLQLRLDPNFFSLLPTDDPGVRAFFDIAEDIGFQSRLVVMIERPERLDVQAAEDFVKRFAQQLATSPLIKTVMYKTPEPDWPKIFDRLLAHLPLVLTAQELERLAYKLSDQQITQQVHINRQLLMSPMGIAAQEIIALDPLGLSEILEPRLRSASGAQQLMPISPGIFQTPDERMFFLFVIPTEPPQDLAFSKQLMQTVREHEQTVRKTLDAQWDGFSEALQVHYTGGYPIAISDEASTKRDIQVTLLTSCVGIMILFVLVFRSMRILFYVGLPLLCSLLTCFI